MSCVESFNNLCRRIVSPNRHAMNDHDMSKVVVMLVARKFRSRHVQYEIK